MFCSCMSILKQTAIFAPVVEHWLEREIVKWVHHEGSNTFTMALHLVPRDRQGLGLGIGSD